MRNNMGIVDRIARLILVIVIFSLYYSHVITGALAAVLLIVAAIFALTSLIGVCPLYGLLGWTTRRAKKP